MENITPSSAVVQAYDGDTGLYEPDRLLAPTMLYPRVTADAKDGTFSGGIVNARLSDIVWLADGVDVTTLSGYSVDDSESDTRGTLTIKKNLPSGKTVKLVFSGKLTDSRTEQVYSLRSSEVILSTTTKTGDKWSISFDGDAIITYDPIADEYLDEVYMHDHGTLDKVTAQPTDKGSYLRSLFYNIYKGAYAVDSDGMIEYGAKLQILKDGKEVEPGETTPFVGHDEISQALHFDMRFADGETYVLRLINKAGFEVARKVITLRRNVAPVTLEIVSTATVAADATKHLNRVIVKSRGVPLQCPERELQLQWLSQVVHSATSADSGYVEHNIGEMGEISLEKAGFNPASDDYMNVAIDYTPKGTYEVIADSTGEQYTMDGEYAIARLIE
jgi:hypothetical protein